MRFLGFAAVYLALVSPALAADGFTEAQKQEIRQVVRDYLVSDPTVVKDAVDALQAKMQADELARVNSVIKEQHDALFKSPTSPVGGNPKGDVTVVEFFDYNCGYCHATAPLVEALIKDDPGVRLVYKEFPILSESSAAAATAALSAAKQGKYVEFHNELFSSEGEVTMDRLLAAATKVGLNVDKWKKDLGDADVAKEIEANRGLAVRLGIRGTPGFIIGDKMYPGAMSGEQLKAAVASARADKKSK